MHMCLARLPVRAIISMTDYLFTSSTCAFTGISVNDDDLPRMTFHQAHNATEAKQNNMLVDVTTVLAVRVICSIVEDVLDEP